MSGIFGIFNRNGKPVDVDREIVNTMLDASSSWGPDDHGTWISGPVALGHTMLWNTPESKLEHLPSTQEHLSITMDARLDNREELAEKLSMKHQPLRQITDSDFILAAYRRWGEECPKYLLGDFAFAIWDEKERKLFCARDHVGIKPFYYHLSDQLLVFSSEIRSLIAHQHVPKEFSNEGIAIYLKKAGLLHPTITFFDEIKKLPPATTVSIQSGMIKTATYWKAENSPDIRLGSLDEYSALLTELLHDAVHTRVSSDYPVASHLSGGLDSSAIAVVASRKLKENNQQLHAFNWVQAPSESDDPDHFEWANSRRIAQLENILHHHVKLDEMMLADIFSKCDLATNDSTDLWYEFPLRKIAADRGIRTMLSGWGGDELISYNGGGYYADAFWHGKIIAVIKELYRNSKRREHRWRRLLKSCYSNLIVPIMPDALYCRLPRVNCNGLGFPELIDPEFSRMMQRYRSFGESIPGMGVRERQLGLYNYGHIVGRVESWAASSKKMDYRYPLLDKRIVEFALGIPAGLFLQNGKGRYIYRHAVSNILPPNICWGESKSEPARVDHYLDVSLKSHQYWLEHTISKCQVLNSNHHINIENLYDIIRKTSETRPEDIDMLIEISDGIGMAIMVLGMGLSMSSLGAPSFLSCKKHDIISG